MLVVEDGDRRCVRVGGGRTKNVVRVSAHRGQIHRIPVGGSDHRADDVAEGAADRGARRSADDGLVRGGQAVSGVCRRPTDPVRAQYREQQRVEVRRETSSAAVGRVRPLSPASVPSPVPFVPPRLDDHGAVSEADRYPYECGCRRLTGEEPRRQRHLVTPWGQRGSAGSWQTPPRTAPAGGSCGSPRGRWIDSPRAAPPPPHVERDNVTRSRPVNTNHRLGASNSPCPMARITPVGATHRRQAGCPGGSGCHARCRAGASENRRFTPTCNNSRRFGDSDGPGRTPQRDRGRRRG